MLAVWPSSRLRKSRSRSTRGKAPQPDSARSRTVSVLTPIRLVNPASTSVASVREKRRHNAGGRTSRGLSDEADRRTSIPGLDLELADDPAVAVVHDHVLDHASPVRAAHRDRE